MANGVAPNRRIVGSRRSNSLDFNKKVASLSPGPELNNPWTAPELLPVSPVSPGLQSPSGPPRARSPRSPREQVMSVEQLQERHKRAMQKLQDPVTEKAKGEAELAEAKARWERAKAVEAAAQRKKEERLQREGAEAGKESGGKGKARAKRPPPINTDVGGGEPQARGPKTPKTPKTPRRVLPAERIAEWQKQAEAEQDRPTAPSRRKSRASSGDMSRPPSSFPAN